MLSRSSRMNKKEVEEVIKKGGFHNSPSFSYKTYTKNDALLSKFSVIASKKTFPLAVERNKIKRKVREALRIVLKRNIEKQKGGEKTFKIVIFAKKQVKDLTQNKIVEELEKNTLIS